MSNCIPLFNANAITYPYLNVVLATPFLIVKRGLAYKLERQTLFMQKVQYKILEKGTVRMKSKLSLLYHQL